MQEVLYSSDTRLRQLLQVRSGLASPPSATTAASGVDAASFHITKQGVMRLQQQSRGGLSQAMAQELSSTGLTAEYPKELWKGEAKLCKVKVFRQGSSMQQGCQTAVPAHLCKAAWKESKIVLTAVTNATDRQTKYHKNGSCGCGSCRSSFWRHTLPQQHGSSPGSSRGVCSDNKLHYLEPCWPM